MATEQTMTLSQSYQQLQEEQPKLRIRQAAKVIGVSELELLELDLGSNTVRLSGDWKAFLEEVHLLGKVMALTRNEYAVHERKGVYNNVSFMKNGNMGVAVNPDIDLRFLMWDWKYGYAVRMVKAKRTLHSFQFFNAQGEAVHKIYLTEQSDPVAYEQLLEAYRSNDQTSTTVVEPATEAAPTTTTLSEADVQSFQSEWLALKDTHDFFPLLKKYELSRTQALHYAPEGHATQVANDTTQQVVQEAASKEIPIMVFVNSGGCIQIHTGPVKRIVPMEKWFNIMDPDFNLHLDVTGIAESWVVKKPTEDGIVTSLELFDSNGQLIAYFFGKRKPGSPELKAWQDVINDRAMTIAID